MATEQLRILVNAVTGGAVADIQKVTAATVEAGAAQKAMGTTSSVAGGLAGKAMAFLKTGAGQASAALAVAAVAATKFAIDAANEFSDLTAEVRAFQRVAGGTAEDASRLVFAMQRLGIDADTGARAMQRLGRDVGDGKGKLAEFGIEVGHNADGSTNLTKTLLNVSDAYKAIKDPAERANMVFQLFGRQGQSINALLGQGSAELQKFFAIAAQDHRVFSQADLDAGRDYKRAVFDLNAALKGFEVTVGREVVPALTSLARGVTEAAHAIDNLRQQAQDVLGDSGFNAGIDTAIKSIPGIGPAVGLAVDAFGLLGGSEDSAGSKAEEHRKKVEAQQAAVDKLTASIQAETAAQWGQITATLAAEGSLLAVEASANAYSDALSKNGAGALETRQALNQYETSIVSAAKAQGEAAAAALGPGASAQERLRASTKASSDAFLFLASTAAPDAREKLLEVGRAAGVIPPAANVRVGADTSGFFGQLNWVRSQLPLVAASHASPGIGAARGSWRTFFAEGGIVNTPTSAVVGEAGPEAIIPLSRPSRAAQIMNEAGLGGRGGGVTLNVSVAPFSDPQAVAGEIAEMLRKLQRQTGSLGLN